MAVDIAKLQVHVGADTKEAESGLGRISELVGGIGSAVAMGGAAAAAGLGALLSTSVKFASDFEATLSGITSVSGATATEMQSISALALQLGKDTSFSASEAAAGIEELIKGGVSIGDVMSGAAKATLNLAAAGEVGLTDAAEIAANAMSMFGLAGKDLAHVSDLIAGAANASSLEVIDFRYSLQMAGAVASISGQSFDDLATAIAVMGSQGLKGSDAGTSLKTMLMNLQPTTKQATTAMRELGLLTEDGTNAFIDQAGAIKPMREIAAELNRATADLTESEKLMYLEMIFGSDAIRAASVLAKAGAEGFDEMAASMSKVTAESVAAERLNNLQGDLEQLKGSAETAGIALGTAMLPGLRNVTQGATGLINAAIPWIEQYGPALAQEIGNLVGLVNQGPGALFDQLSASMVAFAPTGERIGQAFANIGVAISSVIPEPVMSLVGGLGEMANAATGGAGPLETLANVVNAVSGAIAGATSFIQDNVAVQAVLVTAVTATGAAWGISTAAAIAHGVATKATAVATGVMTAAQTALNLVLTANPIGLVVIALAGLAAGIKYAYDNSEDFRAICDRVFSFLRDVAMAIIEGAKAKIAELTQNWNDTTAAVRGFFDMLGKLGEEVGKAKTQAEALGKALLDGIVSGLGGLYDATLGKLWEGLGGAIGEVKKRLGIRSPSRVMAEMGRNMVEGLVLGVKQESTTFTEVLGQLVEGPASLDWPSLRAMGHLVSVTPTAATVAGISGGGTRPAAGRLAQTAIARDMETALAGGLLRATEIVKSQVERDMETALQGGFLRATEGIASQVERDMQMVLSAGLARATEGREAAALPSGGRGGLQPTTLVFKWPNGTEIVAEVMAEPQAVQDLVRGLERYGALRRERGG